MAAEILETLESLGVAVQVIGPDRLRLQPASKIPQDLVPRIREAKPEILEALRRRWVLPVRSTRHHPWSIATLRMMIAQILLRRLKGCPFCGTPFL